MHRLLATLAAPAALLIALSGCAVDSASSAAPAAASRAAKSATSARAKVTQAPARAKARPGKDYAAAAKREIAENICITKAPDCKYIKSYGMIVNALVAHTSLYPDSDATEPAQAICGWLLSYVIDSGAPESELSSDAYVYGSTRSRIAKCHTPADRT